MRFFRITITLLFALAILACSTFKPGKTQPQELFDPEEAGYTGNLLTEYYFSEGIKQAHIYGDDSTALAFFDKAITADSTHAPSYYEAARVLAPTDPQRALLYAAVSTRLDTAQIWYRTQYGRLLVLNRHYDQALLTYKRLLRESPADPDVYSMLAALYEQQRQPFTAIALLDSAEHKLGKIEELAAYKRGLLIHARLYDKAIAETQQLINEYPYKYDNYLILADLYSQTGKDSLALATYNKALELNPGSVDVLVSLNEYYKRKNDNPNFLATTKQLFRNDDIPLETKIRFYNNLVSTRDFYRDYFFQISDLASLLILKYPYEYEVIDIYSSNLIAYGDLEQALSFLKGYIDKPQVVRTELLNDIISMEAYLQRQDSVSKYVDIALELYPDNAEIHLRHGGILSYMGNDKEAIKAFEKALHYADTDSVRSSILGTIGDSYHQLENERKCFRYYEKALKLWPDNVMVLNNYAYFLSEQGKDLDKALSMAERVMHLEPGNPTYLDTYGWVLYKLGRYEDAKKAVQLAISLDSRGSAELLMHYGDIHFAMGDKFMAGLYWRKAMEAGADKEKIDQRLLTIQ